MEGDLRSKERRTARTVFARTRTEITSSQRVPPAVTPDAASRAEEGSAALNSSGSSPNGGQKLTAEREEGAPRAH
jgi:hypothetical protein